MRRGKGTRTSLRKAAWSGRKWAEEDRALRGRRRAYRRYEAAEQIRCLRSSIRVTVKGTMTAQGKHCRQIEAGWRQSISVSAAKKQMKDLDEDG